MPADETTLPATTPPRPPNPPLRRRTRMLAAAALAGWLALGVGGAAAAVWSVGPGPGELSFTRALREAADGDVIDVAPGDYPGQVGVIHQRRLTIRGTGERPVFRAAGRHAEGKAIWVVRDGDIAIENIEFRGARVPGGNGAGIRFQRGRLSVRRCAFVDNQMGLLTSDDPQATLVVADSEFSDAPVNPGSLPHLLYVGRIARFELTGSTLQRGREGHLVKSRARESLIVGNLIDDGASGRASYQIDLPNGGLARVERNTIGQGAVTGNETMVSYGAEGHPWPDSALTVAGNTFINRLAAGGWFVRVWPERLPAGTRVTSRDNLLRGPGGMWLGPGADAAGDRSAPAPTR